MTRSKKKSIFNTQSQKTEKYLGALRKAKSESTDDSSDTSAEETKTTGTDAPLDSRVAPSYSKRLEKPKWLSLIFWILGITTPVLWFFWSMNASINSTTTNVAKIEEDIEKLNPKVIEIQEKISSIEKSMSVFSKESDEKQYEIKLYFEKIVGKIEGWLLNNSSMKQELNAVQSISNKN